MTHPQPDSTFQANPVIVKMWSERTKCLMCKHRFEKPFILPVEKPERGKFQPNINVEVLFHLQDTHGLPHETVRSWINGSVYGDELTLFGARNFGAYND